MEEIVGRLSGLTGAQLGRLEDELRRERQRRASSEGGGEGAPQIHEGTAPPVTEVLEYRPYEDGYLQLELRRYIRRDGSARERGPYWYFQFHEGGKRKKLDCGVEVRRIFHKLRSLADENFNEHFKSIFEVHEQVPTKGRVNTARFALGAVLVYQLALLYRHERNSELNRVLKPFLRAA